MRVLYHINMSYRIAHQDIPLLGIRRCQAQKSMIHCVGSKRSPVCAHSSEPVSHYAGACESEE